MNWAFNIREKTKLALAFSFILLMVLIINWFLSYNIKIISSEFSSIYKDRLIPAVDISNILEKTFQSRYYLEQHVLSKGDDYEQIEKKLSQNSNDIKLLMIKFEKTFLVNEENLYLNLYKKRSEIQRLSETEIIKLSRANNKKEAMYLFQSKNNKEFLETVKQIHDLIVIQEKVGRELHQLNTVRISTIAIMLELSVVIALIISLIIFMLMRASLTIVKSPQRTNDYNLN